MVDQTSFKRNRTSAAKWTIQLTSLIPETVVGQIHPPHKILSFVTLPGFVTSFPVALGINAATVIATGALVSIDASRLGHRELSYYRNANVRHGECVAHTNSGDIPVKFIVEWRDRE